MDCVFLKTVGGQERLFRDVSRISHECSHQVNVPLSPKNSIFVKKGQILEKWTYMWPTEVVVKLSYLCYNTESQAQMLTFDVQLLVHDHVDGLLYKKQTLFSNIFSFL